MEKKKLPRFKDGQVLNAADLNKFSEEIENTRDNFDKKIDNFYGKLIEIFGVFIALFSFIILGINASFKCEGDFIDKLVCSSAIFLPITLVMIILVLIVHYLKR